MSAFGQRISDPTGIIMRDKDGKEIGNTNDLEIPDPEEFSKKTVKEEKRLDETSK